MVKLLSLLVGVKLAFSTFPSISTFKVLLNNVLSKLRTNFPVSGGCGLALLPPVLGDDDDGGVVVVGFSTVVKVFPSPLMLIWNFPLIECFTTSMFQI